MYLRALAGISPNEETYQGMVSDEEDRKVLWNDFLELVKGNKSGENITLEELQKAVEEDHVKPLKRKAELEAENESKKTKSEEMEMDEEPEKTEPEEPTDPNRLSKEQIEKANTVTTESNELMRLTSSPTTGTSPSEVVALWLVKDGDSHPIAPPPLFHPSPPKLNDMSGRDLVGTEVALQLVCMQLKHAPEDSNGTILLEICRGCWAMYYLMERRTSQSLNALDAQLTKELNELDSNLNERHAVAIGTPAESAVQQTNLMERNQFLHSCNVRRQTLLNQIAWDFRYLLATQQQILTKAKVPCFNGVSVDQDVILAQTRVCTVLHSAFYVRGKVGEDAHVKPLGKLEESLLKALQEEQEQEKVPPSQPPPPSFQQYQQRPKKRKPGRPRKNPVKPQIPSIPPYGQQQVVYPQQPFYQQQQFNPAFGAAQQQDYNMMMQQQQNNNKSGRRQYYS